MPFETINSVHGGRRSTTPVIRISRNAIYLNQFLNSTIKARNVEIQVDKATSRIRLIFKEKETSTSRRLNRMQSAASIAFKNILETLELKEPVTINATLEGNQVTGTYKEKTKAAKPVLKIAKK
jgi:glutamate-1-semialdehyde aminotransferase